MLAANHRSFLDPFAIGCCIRRPIYFVAKQELFEIPVFGAGTRHVAKLLAESAGVELR